MNDHKNSARVSILRTELYELRHVLGKQAYKWISSKFLRGYDNVPPRLFDILDFWKIEYRTWEKIEKKYSELRFYMRNNTINKEAILLMYTYILKEYPEHAIRIANGNTTSEEDKFMQEVNEKLLQGVQFSPLKKGKPSVRSTNMY